MQTKLAPLGFLIAAAVAGMLGACGGAHEQVTNAAPLEQVTTASLTAPDFELQEFSAYVVEPAGPEHLVAGVNVATGTFCRTTLLDEHTQPIGEFWFDSAGVDAAYHTATGDMAAEFASIATHTRNNNIGQGTLAIIGADGRFAPYASGQVHMTWGPDPVFGPGPCDFVEHCTCHISAH